MVWVGVIIYGLLLLSMIPLYFGKIKPNWHYGVRTDAAVDNPQIWYQINKAAAKVLIPVSSIAFAINLIASDSQRNIMLIAFTIFMVIFSLYIAIYASKMRERFEEEK